MDMEDFKSFFFVLGVDVDELSGEMESARVTELVLLFDLRRQIDLSEDAFTDLNSID